MAGVRGWWRRHSTSVNQYSTLAGYDGPISETGIGLGTSQFLVSHSPRPLGSNENVHVLEMDSDIGWKEEQKMPVSLTEARLRLQETVASTLAEW